MPSPTSEFADTIGLLFGDEAFRVLQGDNPGIGDFVNLLTASALQEFGTFQPLQKQSANLLTSVLSGGTEADSVLNQLLAPDIAKIRAGTAQEERQLRNSVPRALANQGIANLAAAKQSAIGDLVSGTRESFIGPALNAGVGLSSRFTAPLTSAANIRIGQRASSAGK